MDIEIKFEEGDHGDGHPFDENDSVVAHAFHFVLNSEVHFDDSEKWTINNPYNNGKICDLIATIFFNLTLFSPLYRQYIRSLGTLNCMLLNVYLNVIC